jgi:hypothetical protein
MQPRRLRLGSKSGIRCRRGDPPIQAMDNGANASGRKRDGGGSRAGGLGARRSNERDGTPTSGQGSSNLARANSPYSPFRAASSFCAKEP